MQKIDPLPVVLDSSDIAARFRFDPARSGSLSLDDVIAQAQKLISPRAVFDVAYVGEKGERTIELGGVVFESGLLRKNLEISNKVFPFIITVGPELEREAAARGDLLVQYYLEEIANLALEQAASRLAKTLEARFGLPSLSSLSPGSLADWPITEQPKLFSLFGDTKSLVGVRLTDSLFMIPRKSISGIFFPSEEGFVACQLCDRENCPGRKAAFSADSST